MLGRAVEVFRLADEVAKRGRQGQHNPAGARTSGLRGRRATPQVRTQRRAAWLVDDRLKGWGKRTGFRRYVRGSNLVTGKIFLHIFYQPSPAIPMEDPCAKHARIYVQVLKCGDRGGRRQTVLRGA